MAFSTKRREALHKIGHSLDATARNGAYLRTQAAYNLLGSSFGYKKKSLDICKFLC